MSERTSNPGDTIRVNGIARPFEHGTIADLLRGLGREPSTVGIAVAVDGRVVPRQDWERRRIRPGDSIDVVGATQGG